MMMLNPPILGPHIVIIFIIFILIFFFNFFFFLFLVQSPTYKKGEVKESDERERESSLMYRVLSFGKHLRAVCD